MDSKIYDEILPIYQEGKINWQEIADQFGFDSKNAARKQFARERKKRGDAPVSSVEHADELEERERTTYTENDESIHVVCDSKRIRTREDVIEHFNVDTNIWKIKEFTVKTSEGYRKDRKVEWEVKDGKVTNGSVDDSGKILVVPMMHTVTTFVRKSAIGITFEDVDTFFKTFDSKSLSRFSSARQYALGGLVLEINLADAHVGNESLSFEELKKRVEDVVIEVKRKSRGLSFEKIILVQLGDIFHFDTYNRTTTSGTHITYGSDQFTMFDNGILLMTWMINELAEISKVDVVNIYGNHDKSSAYMLAKTLEAGFKDDPNVSIDATHSNRKFREIGSTSIAYVHGDMSKSQLYDTFQKEERELFGRTLYSEIHVGHIHHEVSVEKSGVVVRWLPSLTIPDQWHKDNGYTGAKQATQCFVYDTLRDGYVDSWIIPVHNQKRKSLT